jgi:polar amino acid transport system permease protein
VGIDGLRVIGERLPELLLATLVNLEIFAALIPIGFAFGIGVALAQVYGPRWLGLLASAWEWFFRGVPALVLLFLFFYGLGRTGVDVSAFLAGALAMGFRSSGYQSQIFRGAIQAVPAGQVTAARSLGMSRMQAVISIVLPQALRLSIPAWSNEFSSVLKDTTLVYAIGINEVMRYARTVYVNYPSLALITFLTVALIFWLLTTLGNAALHGLERYLAVPGFEARGSASNNGSR